MKDLACWMPGKRRVLLTSQRVSCLLGLREVKVRRFMADALLSCSGYVQMNAAPGSHICRGSLAGMGSNLTLPCPRGLLGEQSWLCWSSPRPCCLTLEAVLRSKALMHVVTVVSKGEEVSDVEYLALLGRPCCWWVLWPWMEMFVPITKGWGVLWFCKVQAWAEHAFENIKLYFAINLEINVWN